jgi:transposase
VTPQECHKSRKESSPHLTVSKQYWDKGRIHRHHEVKAWCATQPRLQVEEFPGYAPELNPAEYVWCQSDAALANSVPEELDELGTMLLNTKRRLSRSQNLLWSCIYASDLPWE